MIEEFQESLDWAAMSPRDFSLSDNCMPDRSYSSLLNDPVEPVGCSQWEILLGILILMLEQLVLGFFH